MENKYIPGDLVKYGDKETIKIYVKVNSVSSNEVLTFTGADGLYHPKELISGVPLTPAILEMNGWKKSKRGNGYAGFSFKRKGFPTIHFQGVELFYVNIPSMSSLLIRYVSDLQHLLFGLQLNSDMEV